MSNHTTYYKNLHRDISIPQPHIDYLKTIQYTPIVIFDVGAAVLHWTKEAKKVWPNSKYYLFEAVREVEEFYKEYGEPYTIGVFSDICDKEVIFYEDPIRLGGNSYYRENPKYSPAASEIYKDEKGNKRATTTIDHVCEINNYPEPDLVKIDVQGAEIDILKGMEKTLKSVKHLIVELQHVEYNIGAKQIQESIPFIESLGFELVDNGTENSYFCGNGPDADYHFIKK
jgi:FkbM family methyltransferase